MTVQDVIKTSDVDPFILEKNIQSDYDFVINKMIEIFNPEKITVETLESMESHENDSDDGTRILFMIKSELPRKNFNACVNELFSLIRNGNKYPIYLMMGI